MSLLAQHSNINYFAVLCVIPMLAVVTLTLRRLDTSFLFINQWMGFLEIGLTVFWVAAIGSPIDLIYDTIFIVGFVADLFYILLVAISAGSAFRRPVFWS